MFTRTYLQLLAFVQLPNTGQGQPGLRGAPKCNRRRSGWARTGSAHNQVPSAACRQRQDGKLLPGAQKRRSLSIAKHGAPRLGPAWMKRSKEETCPLDPQVEAGVQSSPLGMREGVSSATPRPAAQESRASMGISRPGLTPWSPIPLSPGAGGLRRGLLARRGDPEERRARRGPGAGTEGGPRGLRGYRSAGRGLSGLPRSLSAQSGRPNQWPAGRGLKSSQGGRGQGRGRGPAPDPASRGYPGCAPTVRVAYAYVHRLTPELRGACLLSVRPSPLPLFQKLPRARLG